MNFISLFAGIGGFDLGLERAGMTCVAQVEIDDFCQKVLTKHWPDVPKFKDVRDVGKHNLPPADLICGGFPCQDVSLAGGRQGLAGRRSTLWSEFYRIVSEVRPKWVVAENVRGLLSSDNGGFFSKILRELSTSGYDAEWHIIPAYTFGAYHLRERVFILAYSNSYGRQNYPRIIESGAIDKWANVTRGGWELPFDRLDSSLRAKLNFGKTLESHFSGVLDGISGRLDEDRIKACGNSVSPPVAEFVGHCILQAERAA